MRTALFAITPLLIALSTPAQWSTPTLLANLNTASSEFDPCPTVTGLTLYFSSNRSGWELFRATRPTPYGAFGAPTHLVELTDPGTDAGPCVRIDELEIVWYSSRAGGGGGGLDLWRATRSSPTALFGTPMPITELNTSASEAGPSLTGNGLTIYFQRGSDLWTATRPNWSSPFGTPSPVTELNTGSVEREPHISLDGLTIYFTSDRAGGVGGNDTWMASRLATSQPFGTPVNLVALNAVEPDTAPAIAVFADEIFFVSTRPGGLGPYDIWSSRFTGLVANGVAGPSSAQALRFSDPLGAGKPYVAAASFGSSPGIRIDSRTLPLNPDALFSFTVGGRPPIMTGYAGILDADGIASGQITFTGLPQLVGVRFFNAFIVIDPQAPSGMSTISNPHELMIQ